MTRFAAAALAAAVLAAPAALSAQDTREELIEEIDAFFHDEMFEHAHWGALIRSMDTGEVWYELNANKVFMPASNEKIPTTAAALLSLGPDFTFTTHVTAAGPIEDGVLKGNLVVFGDGDPTLYERFFDETTDVFEGWADTLKEMGVERIEGGIVGDDDVWSDGRIGYGWTHSGLDAWYSAEYSALQINENYVDLQITAPEAVDGEATITPNVASEYFQIVNDLEVVPDGERSRFSVSREYGGNVIVVSGTIEAGSGSTERSPALENPTAFYVTVLKEVLEENGIRVEDDAVDCDEIPGWDHDPEDFNILITHKSPPLSEIATGLMKRSQNMYAETMVHTMGHHVKGYGSFGNGEDVVKETLEPLGADPGDYVFRDGSGLSRYNYISPETLAAILEGMKDTDVWDVWYDTMPIAGVDGTLRRRMSGTPAEGNVRAKTGTISNTRGLSGYVTTADDEMIVFSFLVNGHLVSSSDTNRITDGVLALIADYSGGEASE